jgi:hypothetical protein
MAFNIYLGIFIVVALAVIIGGTFKIFNLNQGLGAFLFFIGSLTVFIVYGLRWFSSENSIFSQTPVQWPPTINTCPDYLVYYGRKMPDGTVQNTCIDMIGVSKNGSLKVFPKSGDAPAADDYYFSLVTKSTDANAKNMELCQRTIDAGLTWEGISNGESCISPNGDVTPSGGNGGGNGGCPSS